MMPRPSTPYNLRFSNINSMFSTFKQRAARIALALSLAFGASVTTTGCVYRIDIQQGNFLEDKDIDRVAVGMTRVQVRSLLGTPMVADPFESSRWDYVYYLKQGRLKKPEQRHFIVFFEGDKVTKIDRSTPDKQPA